MFAILLAAAIGIPALAAPRRDDARRRWTEVVADAALQRTLEGVRDAALARFADSGLTADGLAISVVDVTDRAAPKRASVRGDQPIYPASVVKAFYLGAVEAWLEAGRLEDSPALRAAVRDMIVDSSNDATHYVVDVLSGVTGGPALPDAELAGWGERRSAVNAFYASLGYAGVNAQQKTWCEGPYGRERQWLGPNLERRNMLTTDATARLLYEIATGQLVTPARSKAMLDLMRRDPRLHAGAFDEQAHMGVGEALPYGAEYYSKAGWTSEVVHDAAFVRLPTGAEYVVVVFTRGVSNDRRVVPFVGRGVLAEMLKRGRKADAVYRNGRVWTGDDDRPWATALALSGQTLLAVGDDEDVRAVSGPATKVVDLGGRLVTPGFVDAHTHAVSSGLQLLSVDVAGTRSPEEFAERVRAYAARLPEGRWIVGGGWDHESWPGAPLPTRQLLDAAAPRNPVFLLRLDGHMAVVNSRALGLAGITRDTKDPAGGAIVRDATGEPAGVVKDSAMLPVQAAIPAPSEADYDAAVDAALAEVARNGVTSIHDIGTWDELAAFERARRSNRMSVRVYFRTPLADWERHAKVLAERGPGDEWVRLGGLKAFMDGSLGSTTAAFFEPYLDAPETTGLFSDEMADPKTFYARMRGADRAGLQLAIHAIGDRANAVLVDMFERVARDNGPRDRRFRVEHAQHLRQAEIGRIARDRIIASMQPYHAIDDGRWAGKRLDGRRLRGTYAFRSLLDMGAPLAFGSDWPVAPIDAIAGMYAATTRRTLDDKNPDGWIPEQKIAIEEALRAFTLGGAYAAFEEEVKGRLAPGYLADFVVLSSDLFAVDPVKLRDVRVERTIVGGRQVFPKE